MTSLVKGTMIDRGQSAAAADSRSRRRRVDLLALLAASALGCRSPERVVEPGAALLRVERAEGAPVSDELRVWAWDDRGTIWDDVRVPRSGALPAATGREVGTILLHPDAVQGAVRVYVRGLAEGVRMVDGFVMITSLTDGARTFEILLDTGAIDDCPFVPSAGDGICPPPSPQDAGGALDDGGSSPVDGEAGRDGAAGGAAGGGAPSGGTSGRGGTGISSSGAAGGNGSGAGAGSNGGGGAGRTTGSGGPGGANPAGGMDLGGSVASGGTTGTGGSAEVVSPPPSISLPGIACTSEQTDARCDTAGSVCYKYCGPEHQGYKTVTCNKKNYVEGDCTFSRTTNYGCYAVDSVASCALLPPTSGMACSVADCKPCGSAVGVGYFDGTNVPKVGYCVCSEGHWSCASAGSWPCPGRPGC